MVLLLGLEILYTYREWYPQVGQEKTALTAPCPRLLLELEKSVLRRKQDNRRRARRELIQRSPRHRVPCGLRTGETRRNGNSSPGCRGLRSATGALEVSERQRAGRWRQSKENESNVLLGQDYLEFLFSQFFKS